MDNIELIKARTWLQHCLKMLSDCAEHSASFDKITEWYIEAKKADTKFKKLNEAFGKAKKTASEAQAKKVLEEAKKHFEAGVTRNDIPQ